MNLKDDVSEKFLSFLVFRTTQSKKMKKKSKVLDKTASAYDVLVITLDQWLLNFFSYFTLLWKVITKFTFNIKGSVYLLKKNISNKYSVTLMQIFICALI